MDTAIDIGPARPRAVDVATALALVAAALNLVIGVLLLVTVVTTRAIVAPGLVGAVEAITVAFTAALVVGVFAFRRRRRWGRPLLLVLAALGLLTLFAPNALNLAVTLLLIVMSVLLFRRSVSAWSHEGGATPRA